MSTVTPISTGVKYPKKIPREDLITPRFNGFCEWLNGSERIREEHPGTFNANTNGLVLGISKAIWPLYVPLQMLGLVSEDFTRAARAFYGACWSVVYSCYRPFAKDRTVINPQDENGNRKDVSNGIQKLYNFNEHFRVWMGSLVSLVYGGGALGMLWGLFNKNEDFFDKSAGVYTTGMLNQNQIFASMDFANVLKRKYNPDILSELDRDKTHLKSKVELASSIFFIPHIITRATATLRMIGVNLGETLERIENVIGYIGYGLWASRFGLVKGSDKEGGDLTKPNENVKDTAKTVDKLIYDTQRQSSYFFKTILPGLSFISAFSEGFGFREFAEKAFKLEGILERLNPMIAAWSIHGTWFTKYLERNKLKAGSSTPEPESTPPEADKVRFTPSPHYKKISSSGVNSVRAISELNNALTKLIETDSSNKGHIERILKKAQKISSLNDQEVSLLFQYSEDRKIRPELLLELANVFHGRFIEGGELISHVRDTNKVFNTDFLEKQAQRGNVCYVYANACRKNISPERANKIINDSYHRTLPDETIKLVESLKSGRRFSDDENLPNALALDVFAIISGTKKGTLTGYDLKLEHLLKAMKSGHCPTKWTRVVGFATKGLSDEGLYFNKEDMYEEMRKGNIPTIAIEDLKESLGSEKVTESLNHIKSFIEPRLSQIKNKLSGQPVLEIDSYHCFDAFYLKLISQQDLETAAGNGSISSDDIDKNKGILSKELHESLFKIAVDRELSAQASELMNKLKNADYIATDEEYDQISKLARCNLHGFNWKLVKDYILEPEGLNEEFNNPTERDAALKERLSKPNTEKVVTEVLSGRRKDKRAKNATILSIGLGLWNKTEDDLIDATRNGYIQLSDIERVKNVLPTKLVNRVEDELQMSL